MKKKTNKTGRYAILGISVIVLCAVFIAFLFKITGVDETDTQVMAESISGEAITEGVSGELENINNEGSDSTDTGVMGDGADSDVLAENASDAGDDSMDDGLQSDATEVKSDNDEVNGELLSDDAKTEVAEVTGTTSSEGVDETDMVDGAADGGEASSGKNDGKKSNEGLQENSTDNVEDNSEGTESSKASDNDETAAKSDSSEDGELNNSAKTTDSASNGENATAPQTQTTGGHIIVIDPGHQGSGMSEKEPNGPGSSTMKAKVTSGTSGKTSGLAEYQLTLTVGLKLRDELVNRGYTVIMTRESNDVQLSNVDRAQIANNAGAEAFIRIHANGSDDTSVNGAMTICQTPSNPYNSAYYSQSRALSDCVLDAFVASTGCKKQKVWETDTMTGINWANVPSTIIEMGYMSNPTEDSNMASEAYQQQMVTGMANGIDNFFAR